MAWLSPSELVTADFTLRPFRIGDGPALFDAVDASRSHLLPHIRWVENHVDVEASEWDARGMAARYLNDTDFALAIARGDEILGGTGFHLRGRALAEHVAEIGMWIRADRAGRGLGKSVLRAMIAWGFSDSWPFQRLEWKCDVANVASRRVAESCGLLLETSTPECIYASKRAPR